jgi:hypothetical protein
VHSRYTPARTAARLDRCEVPHAQSAHEAGGDTIDEPGTPEQDKMVKYVFRGFGKDTFNFEGTT